jgi:7,8-dihydro-6-hydroxymethylpterin dimethyltransferase
MIVEREKTESLCPVCFDRIPAQREFKGEDVFLVKTCPVHGEFRTLIWRGPPSFEKWARPKVPATPPVIHTEVLRGCPYDCGLCPDHRQRSCTVIMEITQRCDLHCSVCYADSGSKSKEDPSLDLISTWFEAMAATGKACNIQVSGGEPTTRDDLPAIVARGRDLGFFFIQINTNGIRLGRDPGYVKDLKQAGLSSVFLQFDGTEDEIYLRVRGRRLLEEKRRAIEICKEQGIGVVLVPTVIPGVNDHNLGDILKQAVAWSPTVRAVHFQPVSYFGRYPHPPADSDRITLPELMRAIEEQSEGKFQFGDFRPPGCENALCSFHGNYLILSDGSVRSLQKPFGETCCSGREKAEEGATQSISYVARQWSAPSSIGSNASFSGSCFSPPTGSSRSTDFISLDNFISRARTHTFSISAMAFQDVWSVDLERVRDCCIHVMAPDGHLVPFCAYNLTDVHGHALYRS